MNILAMTRIILKQKISSILAMTMEERKYNAILAKFPFVFLEIEKTMLNLSQLKTQKNFSEIENKILAIYAIGMSQRDINATTNEIYGVKLSKDKI